MVQKIVTPEQKEAVDAYIAAVSTKSDLERTELSKEKTGVFTGAYAINPVNGKKSQSGLQTMYKHIRNRCDYGRSSSR